MILEMAWMHQLELIDINHLPQNELLPSFISAQNACPPEDCGGIHRSQEMIEIVKDPCTNPLIDWTKF